MAYGLNRILPAETGSSETGNGRLRFGFAAWRKLDEQSRLQLIEGQLKPANDLIDGYPLAL